MNLRNINFRQPKYIFPAVVAIPLGALLYFITNMFGGEAEQVATDHINMNLPEAKNLSEYDKLRSMENRYEKDDKSFTVIDGFENDESGKEKLDDSYSEEELQKLITEAEQKAKEQQQIAEMQRNLEASTRRMRNSNPSRGSYRSGGAAQDYGGDVERRLNEIRSQADRRMRELNNEPDPDEAARAEANRLALEEQKRQEEEQPSEVIKAASLTHSLFNTVESQSATSDSPLIKAMIDKTTKSTEGTRLRFKLLDDVIIDDVKLLKGTYLYGTVTGFGTQRVKANISSILVGSRFLKVDLSVYDIDGMEGFYVPESSFRDFVQNAAAGVANQQIQFNNNGNSGRGFNAENFALQALQNIYQAGSSALSRNVKKNKAKIKYNTIVYLINTRNV